MNDTGGYFELELSDGQHRYHDTPYQLKSGRASLRHMLDFVRPSLIHIPYYTCDALLEPFEQASVNYNFYEINELLEPVNLPALGAGEYFLCINYFGIQEEIVTALSGQYGDKLIVDGTQAFFMKGNGLSWFFNSCRKFFGVPDGSYLYPPAGVKMPPAEGENEGYITEHLLQRFNGHTHDGYAYFLRNEALAGDGVTAISRLSERLLSNVDYAGVAERRCENYRFLQERLQEINLFKGFPGMEDVPMFFPLLLDKKIDRQLFYDKKIFIPMLWKEVQLRNIPGFHFEKGLPDRLYPLPIDHRYSLEEMEQLYQTLMSIIK